MIEVTPPVYPQIEGTPLFLAGGITNCPDWQADAVSRLVNTNLLVLNPRRKHFPIDDPKAAREQIRWEFAHLRLASGIVFWFPKETICPIALLELGGRLEANRNSGLTGRYQDLFIGTDPDYVRRTDVLIQSELHGFELDIHNSFDSLMDEVIDFYNSSL